MEVLISLNYIGPGVISLTLDTWTSPNAISFLGITAHWIDDDWNLIEILADFCKLSGSHTGENIADTFVDSCKKLGILTKVSNAFSFYEYEA